MAFGVHDACRAERFSQRKRMVDRAGILDSQLAGHDGRAARAVHVLLSRTKNPFTTTCKHRGTCNYGINAR